MAAMRATAMALLELGEEQLREEETIRSRLQRLKQLQEGGVFTREEYENKVKETTGVRVEQLEDFLEMKRKEREDLEEEIEKTEKELQDIEDGVYPLPRGLTEETLQSKYFQEVCKAYGVNTRDLCDAELKRADYERLKTVREKERISKEQFKIKVQALLNCETESAETVLQGMLLSKEELVRKILESTRALFQKEIQSDEDQKRSTQKRNEFLQGVQSRIDAAIKKEKVKAEQSVIRKRAMLEQLLVERAIQDQVSTMLDHRDHIDQCPSPVLKKAAHFTAGLVPKSTAAVERKKLFLKGIKERARSPTTSANGIPSSHLERVKAVKERRQRIEELRSSEIRRKHEEKFRIADETLRKLALKNEERMKMLHLKEAENNAKRARIWLQDSQRQSEIMHKIQETDSRISE
eukprot:750480-Hanusia_phi.AAC.8